MIQTVCHDVVEKKTGKTVGAIETTWDTMSPGEFNLDGFPTAAVLLSRNSFGAVPAGVKAVIDGTATGSDWQEAQRFALVPHHTV